MDPRQVCGVIMVGQQDVAPQVPALNAWEPWGTMPWGTAKKPGTCATAVRESEGTKVQIVSSCNTWQNTTMQIALLC